MIENQSTVIWQPSEAEIAKVYNYLREYVVNNHPEIVIGEFRRLFMQGKSEASEVNQALEKIVTSEKIDWQFNCTINYCYQIIIYYWAQDLASHEYIVELIALFNGIQFQPKSYDRRKARLLKLIQSYQETEAYFKLKCLASIIVANGSLELNKEDFFGTLAPRYTFLYQYFLLDTNNIPQFEALITSIQQENQKKFEFQLSQHIIYRSRLVQAARINLLSRGAGKVITRVRNPLLLSEKGMGRAIKNYIGKFDKQHTLLYLAQQFTARNPVRSSYKEFKQDLYQYLTYNIQPRNSSYLLHNKLQHKLDTIFPTSDAKQLNQSLILQTCKQLVSFLLVENSHPIDPNRFAELVMNLGTTKTSILLMKIVLICPEIRADLEKKIALIFAYYQSQQIKDALWFVKLLEYLLMAFSIYLGKIDVSIAKNI